ncbi:hypothetical protein E4U55_001860 [Claviceps digitariae]|nr:hypothetical protein E4U55_001860 [Claviceps digitariae]
MSFSASSQDLWLEDSHILHASCRDLEDNFQDSSLDLNQVLGNENGYFRWGGEDFAMTASEVELDGSVLSAIMLTEEGEPRERQGIDLNEHIGNENGRLVYE